MKQFKIAISGSGTKNMIETRLAEVLRDLQGLTENEITEATHIVPFYEDEVLVAEIEDE